VPNGVQTNLAGQKIYDVAHAQIFQGNMLRGFGGMTTPRAGRRVLASPMNTAKAVANNPTHPLGLGMTTLGLDGSMAMIVPAQRALTWQLTDPSGQPVTRERYWITFKAGEVRVCASCHGINDKDQKGQVGEPQNMPSALVNLLNWWKNKPN
jgi:mono/diheme cytochrome c family protein